MNKKMKKIAVGIAGLCVAVGLSVGGAIAFDNNARYSAVAEVSCEAILSEYVVGASFTVPNATIVYKGQNYEATNGVLVFPDGVAKQSGTHMLSMTGEYTVIYTAECNGVTVRAEKKFSVTENSYTVSSDASKVEYGTLQTAKVADTEGIIVTFADGDTFRYAKPIDLTKQDVTDLLLMYPVKGGDIHDAYIYTVTLTDCYDSSVFVNLIISFDQDWEYVRANASGQDVVGLFVPDQRHPGEVEVDGEKYYVHRNNVWGASGKSPRMDPKGVGCRWLYNYAEQKVYLEESAGPRIINQFNHTDIYSEEQQFHGFTTGEVYLSIKPSNYNAASTKVEIESINGESGEALKLASDYKDDRAPTLNVDFKNVNADGNIYAAKGEKFKLFDASAIDIHLLDEVKTSVYYNYGNAYQTSVLTENGYFTPTLLGRYTIVYEVEDSFGNTTTQTVDVNCVETTDGKGITLITSSIDELLAGKDNLLPEHEMVGLNDNVTVEIYAQKDGEKTQIDTQTRTFIPLYHGEYEIVYRYYDSVYDYTYSYKVNCVASDEIRFLDEFLLPRYFIKDAYYTIEKIDAYSFADAQPKAYDAQFMVSFDKGSFIAKNADKVLIEGDFTVQFKFVYQGKEIVSELYPIVDVEFEETSGLEKYFVGEDIVTEQRADVVHCETTRTTGNTTISFVNPISVSAFDFRFIIPKTQANYSAVNIVLTDYYDRENQKVITYKKVGENFYFSVDGGKDYLIKAPYAFDDGEIKRVWYDGAAKKILNNYSNSVAFDFGFQSDLCLFDVEFVGITGASALQVKQLNNQAFMDLGMDFATPTIGVKQSGGSYKQGTVLTIHRAYISDVLSPILTSDVSLSVEGPSGYVTSLDGVLLDGNCDVSRAYEITLSEYGSYIVTYTTKDQNDLDNTLVYYINVVDSVAPVISFEGVPNGVLTIPVGKEYTIASYTVSDNYSSADKVSVTLFVYDEHLGRISTGSKTFTPTQKGTYTIFAYCVDEAGNSVACSYLVQAI